MIELRGVALRRISAMICGHEGAVNFPYRTGGQIVDFFDDMFFDLEDGSGRGRIVDYTLIRLAQDEQSETGLALTTEIAKVIRNLMDETHWDNSEKDHELALDELNSVLGRYGVICVVDAQTHTTAVVDLEGTGAEIGSDGTEGPVVSISGYGYKVVKPTAFKVPPVRDKEKPLCGVMMPFTASLTEIYRKDIRPTVEAQGFRVERADDIWKNEKVLDDIADIILNADVLIADLTGANPNVFYELGIAHLNGTVVIPIVQHESDVPSNLKSDKYLKYDGDTSGRAKLREELEKRLQQLGG